MAGMARAKEGDESRDDTRPACFKAGRAVSFASMSFESRRREAGVDAVDSRTLKGKRGLQRLLNATRYSLDGLHAAWVHESAFRQEALIAAVMVPVALILPVGVIEKILLVGVVVLVLIVELLNTGIEAAVDRDSFEINPLGKRAKDFGSAAVMFALMLAGGTWIAILVTHFL
jgi:diacylglycerol kinase (ATP)